MDKDLKSVLLVACKKRNTRKRSSQEAPTLDIWMDVTMDSYKMEKIMRLLRLKDLILFSQTKDCDIDKKTTQYITMFKKKESVIYQHE